MEAPSIDVRLGLNPASVAEVSGLLDRAFAADQHHPLAEHKRLALVSGGGASFAALMARGSGERLIGYAQLMTGGQTSELEVVVDPAERGPDAAVRRLLVAAAVDRVAEVGGGPLFYWVSQAGDEDDALARSLGFGPDRDLFQLRVPLPLPPEVRAGAPSVAVRPFTVGRDEPAWLAVNQRAFADHPEQGGWVMEDLLERERAPWFNVDGFLLHERHGQLAAFCWTKVHVDIDPSPGEIYVIGVDPAFQGLGLGRALTVAGFGWLAAAGVTEGFLYVDGDNTAAVTLYRSLGMVLDHVDRAYRLDVPPAT